MRFPSLVHVIRGLGINLYLGRPTGHSLSCHSSLALPLPSCCYSVIYFFSFSFSFFFVCRIFFGGGRLQKINTDTNLMRRDRLQLLLPSVCKFNRNKNKEKISMSLKKSSPIKDVTNELYVAYVTVFGLDRGCVSIVIHAITWKRTPSTCPLRRYRGILTSHL